MVGIKGQKGDPGPTGTGRPGARGPPGVKGAQFYSNEEVNSIVVSTLQRFIETEKGGLDKLKEGWLPWPRRLGGAKQQAMSW